uniref:DUF397 domain-containing protein n=1 Tax=Pseudonocardia sp. CA-138482 TaxID=3240023 RepID=UPI003F491789
MKATPPSFAEGEFRKASASQPDKSCVQVARRGGWVEVRDDKTTFGSPADHRLVFTDTEFDAALTGLRAGTTAGLPLHITRRPDGTHTFRRADGTTELGFTAREVTAFLDGVHAGEFDTAAYA